MNPHQPNHSQDVTGEDLLALHLNELAPARVAVVQRILAQDRALAAESTSIAAALAAVTLNAKAVNRSPMPLDQAVLDRNWQAIHSGLVPFTPPSFRWHLPALGAGLLAAAAACIGYLAFTQHRAAPDLTQPNVSGHASPILTAAPSNEQAGLHPSEPAFRAYPYRPKSNNPNAAIRLIPPSFPSTSDSQSAETILQPPLTLLPAPRLTQQPQSAPLTASPTQDLSLKTQPAPAIGSAKSGTYTPGKNRQPHQVDIMFGIGGTFIPEHDSLTAGTEPRTLSVTYATVLIGSVHQQFRPALGYRATLSYTRPQFAYTYSAPSTIPGYSFYENGDLNSRIFEAAATYVMQGPHHKRLTTSADAGTALMAFLPSDHADPGASYAFRGAAVLGVNFDYAITSRIGARLGYRAQLFKSPDFRYNGTAIPITTPLVVDNEPSLGITYTFRNK